MFFFPLLMVFVCLLGPLFALITAYQVYHTSQINNLVNPDNFRWLIFCKHTAFFQFYNTKSSEDLTQIPRALYAASHSGSPAWLRALNLMQEHHSHRVLQKSWMPHFFNRKVFLANWNTGNPFREMSEKPCLPEQALPRSYHWFGLQFEMTSKPISYCLLFVPSHHQMTFHSG